MSNNYCVIPECYVDSCLVEVILYANNEYVNHQKGNGTVAKTMKETFENEFCIGIIDEDRRPIEYLNEFNEVRTDEFLKLWKHKTKHHYIIQIRPEVEEWLLKLCKANKIDLTEFGLPIEKKELMRQTKSITSRKDDRFVRLFKRLMNQNCEPVLRLKKWIEYLKENKYNPNLELI